MTKEFYKIRTLANIHQGVSEQLVEQLAIILAEKDSLMEENEKLKEQLSPKPAESKKE